MMNRRRSLLVLAAAPTALVACGASTAMQFNDIASAVRAVQALVPAGRTHSDNNAGWTLPQVLNHLAQSIEYSISGFPAAKPAWFQATLGRAAFAVFDARGRMSHSLREPIPGAPALAAADPLPHAAARLVQALQAFEAHGGALQPHFAYGALDKARYTRAHLMHLADHWTEIQSKET